MKTPGDMMRDRREELGFSQADIGLDIRTSQRTISAWENNQTIVPRHKAPQVAKALRWDAKETQAFMAAIEALIAQRRPPEPASITEQLEELERLRAAQADLKKTMERVSLLEQRLTKLESGADSHTGTGARRSGRRP